VALGGLIISGALVATANAQAGADGFVIVAAAQSSTSSRDAFAPAARLDPPAHARVDPPLPPAGPNESSCRADLPDAVMNIVIADIGYVCPLYPGGQEMLDAGAATIISDPVLASTLAVQPGDPGTLWVAGHRASHGGPFAAIPTLSIGALVTIADGRLVASYQVVGIERFETRNDKVVDSSGNATSAATLDSILRPDHGADRAPRLLIQTCDGSTARWMVYADLVSVRASGS
jgi:sortase (surface protein transpeptidase)